MRRAIELCGIIAVCTTLASCGSTPPPPEKPSEPSVTAPSSEPVETGAAQEESSAPELVRSDPGDSIQLAGRRENLTCFSGSKDRHARIGVELVNGEVNYFAYYSKWRPRTCSLEAGRGDAFSRWSDNGAYSTVSLADHKGELRIEHMGASYRFGFHNVDRTRYCGMPGKINGSLIVTRGKSGCVVEGVMDGHAM